MKSKWFSVSIAILVSAVMVFGSMPFGIFAAGNTGWYDGSKTSFTISTPEELIGKNVIFVANFKPRKMMGYESCGMILSAEHGDTLSVLTTLKEDTQSGAEIV